MNVRVVAMLLSLLLAIASPASAEWIAELYGGGSFTTKTSATITSSAGTTTSLQDLKVNSSGTVGGRVGYWFNDLHELGAIGVGLDVFHFNADMDQQTVPARSGNLTGTSTIRPLNLSVVGIGLDLLKVRLHLAKSEEFPQGQFQPTFSVGPAIFKTSIDDTNNFTPNNQSRSDTSIGVKVGVGAHYLITNNISLFGEYRFTHFSSDVSFQHLSTTQTLAASFDTNHLIAGVSVHF